MGLRVVLVFVMVLVCCWVCEARHLTNSGLSGSDRIEKNINVCTVCEEYASLTVKYLAENKTHAEIIGALHDACSELHTMKEQCITLVDYYATLFFTQLSSVQPDEFCKKVNLCQGKRILPLQMKESSCDVCHHAVDEIIIKLKDPDTELEIIEILLKACDAMENYAKKCKAMVFEYGPLVLANAEKYLEKTDICTLLHACSVGSISTKEALLDGKILMVTSS